jgi:hypothetical protein
MLQLSKDSSSVLPKPHLQSFSTAAQNVANTHNHEPNRLRNCVLLYLHEKLETGQD